MTLDLNLTRLHLNHFLLRPRVAFPRPWPGWVDLEDQLRYDLETIDWTVDRSIYS
jgi:hypothetical protein